MSFSLKKWLECFFEWWIFKLVQEVIRKEIYSLCTQILKQRILNLSPFTGMKSPTTANMKNHESCTVTHSALRYQAISYDLNLKVSSTICIVQIWIFIYFRTNYTCSRVECVISDIKMLFEDSKGAYNLVNKVFVLYEYLVI